MTMTRIVVVVLAISLGCASLARAQAAAPAQGSPAKELSHYDRIWNSFTQLYRNEKNPVVQQVLFTGRFQHDFVAVDSDEGNHDESNIRRVRLGPRITFLRNYLFHAEVEVNPQERNPFYMRFTDLYVQWSKSGKLALTVGKHAVPFTQEGATSSKDLLTIDRSNLANNIWFGQEYMPGVSVSGRVEPWVYRAGVYSSGAANREFGEFSGGYFTLGVLGYDFAKTLDVKEAVLTGNYVYQHPDVDNTFTQRLEHVASVHFRFEDTLWGLRSDVSTASGYLGQSDLWAVMAMPFVNVTDKFQVVGRYTHIASADANGVRLATYENRIVSGRGDEYNELYLGANYFFYGHKLKLQSGLQWADLNDEVNDGGTFSGVSWVTGVRIGW
jgi:phosphate-selective porin OprO/OprP